MAEQATTRVVGTPPPPPRISGSDPQADIVSVNQWAWEFYKAVVLGQRYLEQAGQFDAGTFDPSSLPDPGNTTIAQAQQTANNAYALAAGADQKATEATDTANAAQTATEAIQAWVHGSVTVSGTATTATVTFVNPQSDTAYNVVLCVKTYDGSPAIEATFIVGQTYTTTGFTITVNAAPGSGNSVTFNWHLRR